MALLIIIDQFGYVVWYVECHEAETICMYTIKLVNLTSYMYQLE